MWEGFTACETKGFRALSTRFRNELLKVMDIRRKFGLQKQLNRAWSIDEGIVLTNIAKKSLFRLFIENEHPFGQRDSPSLSSWYRLNKKPCSPPSGQPFIHCPWVINLTCSLASGIKATSGSSSTSMTSSRLSFEKNIPRQGERKKDYTYTCGFTGIGISRCDTLPWIPPHFEIWIIIQVIFGRNEYH